MKRLIILILVFGFTFQTAFSQEKKHEISAGVGLLGDVQLTAMLTDVIGTLLTLGYGMKQGNKYNFFTPSVNYRYGFAKWFSLGASFGFDTNNVFIARDLNGDGTMQSEEWENKVEHNRYYYTAALEAVFNYMNKPVCRLYGFVGFGGTITSVPSFEVFKTTVFPNFQVTPFGVSVGKSVAGFAEIGYGYKGFLNLGIAYRF